MSILVALTLPLLLLTGCQVPLESFGGEREPDYKNILAEYLRETFKDPSFLRDVSVSHVSSIETSAGKIWRTCLRLDVRDGVTGQFVGLQTYAIIIQNKKVTDRRRAGIDDHCDSEGFEPLRL
jgi:hypothetical protein